MVKDKTVKKFKTVQNYQMYSKLHITAKMLQMKHGWYTYRPTKTWPSIKLEGWARRALINQLTRICWAQIGQSVAIKDKLGHHLIHQE